MSERDRLKVLTEIKTKLINDGFIVSGSGPTKEVYKMTIDAKRWHEIFETEKCNELGLTYTYE